MRLFILLSALVSVSCDGVSKNDTSDTQAPAGADATSPDDGGSAPVDSAEPDDPSDADDGPSDADAGPIDTATTDTANADTADGPDAPSDTAADTDSAEDDTGSDTGAADTGTIAPIAVDLDGDGWSAEDGDCNDYDSSVHPEREESCDGIDNDCDGDIDEDVIPVWYLDSDGDGHGTEDFTYEGCDPMEGYVLLGDDCDDSSDMVYPSADEWCDEVDNNCDGVTDEDVTDTFFLDEDGDGFGDAGFTIEACAVPDGYSENADDCNDLEEAIHPDAVEVCDGADNNCDGDTDEDGAEGATTYYLDADLDGFGDPTTSTESCAMPEGYILDDQDCDDHDNDIHPDALEQCDGEDNDCDGVTDEEDAVDAVTFYFDGDSDGFGDPAVTTSACTVPEDHTDNSDDCDDSNELVNPSADEMCDGTDNDCDGVTDEDDATDAGTFYEDSDDDGYGDEAATTSACALPAGYSSNADDCDDNDNDIYPGADEVCDGEDNDCDGAIDGDDAIDIRAFFFDGDLDGYGDPAISMSACAPPSGYVADSSDCDDSTEAIRPDADEFCNGIDDDCDGEADEGVPVDSSLFYIDIDGDGYGDADTAFLGCDPGPIGVPSPGDCDDGDVAISPAVGEMCDGIDNDCDGTIDEPDATDAAVYYRDEDGDGYGNPSDSMMSCSPPSGYVSDGSDCDDGSSTTYPGAPETLGDGIDQDCDGSDLEYSPHTGSEPGWYHAYGGPFESSIQHNGTVSCASVCGEFGLSPQGARFVCNLWGSSPTEGCDYSNDGLYGDANCGWMVRNMVATTENGNYEDCAGGNIMGCVTGSCSEWVTYHSLECQCE